MKNWKMFSTITLLTLCTLIAGCGFYPRNAANVPGPLHTLYLQTQQPYSDFTTGLKAMLRSLNITLMPHRFDAPYTLKIVHVRFVQSHPSITTTNLAVTMKYSLSVTIKLTSQHSKVIIPEKTLTTSLSFPQNPSQVYTPGTAVLARQQLRRDIISKIYYLLVSNNTRAALDHVH